MRLAREIYIPGNLFAEEPTIVNQIIGGLALVRKSPLRTVGFFKIANKTDGAVAGFGEFASSHSKFAVVIVDEDTITADGVEPAGVNRAVASTFRENRAATMDGPIAERRNIVGREIGAGGVGNAETTDSQIIHWRLLSACKLKNMFEDGNFNKRVVEVGSLLRIVIKNTILFVQEPFARSV